jgi:hypothetical protein
MITERQGEGQVDVDITIDPVTGRRVFAVDVEDMRPEQALDTVTKIKKALLNE